MKQLLLDINTEVPPTLDTFITGQHREVAHLLQLFAQRKPGTLGERSVYLWGETGAGKSHLLRALADTQNAHYINANTQLTDIEYDPAIDLYLLDDCQNLNELQQIAAFNLFNEAKEHKAFLVAAGLLPPAILQVREDLRTRLGWGLIYQIHELTDDDKIAALNLTADARGICIPPGVLPYLITHYQRDMPTLTSIVEALIQFSLETKRTITLPLLREMMQHRNDY